MEFQSSVQEIDEVTKDINVSFGVKLLEDRVSKKLASLQKNAQIKGFRPGKAPMTLVTRYFKDAEWERELKGMVEETLKSVISENSLELSLRPNVSIKSAGQEGKDVEFSARIYLKPKPELNLDIPIEVEAPKLPSTQDQFEKTIYRIKRRLAKFEPLTEGHELSMGDAADISYYIVSDLQHDSQDAKDDTGPVVFDESVGSEIKRQRVVLKSDEVSPDLLDALVGMKKGEVKRVAINNSQNDSLKKITQNEEGDSVESSVDKPIEEGHTHDHACLDENCQHENHVHGQTKELGSAKESNYKVNLHYMLKLDEALSVELPELSDEHLSALNSPYSSIDELKEELMKQVESQMKDSYDDELDNAILNALAKRTPFTIPEGMIYNQLPETLRTLGFRSGMNVGDLWRSLDDNTRRYVLARAEEHVRFGLLLASAATKLEIDVSDEDIKDHFTNLSQQIISGSREITELDSKRYENREWVVNEVMILKTLKKLREIAVVN